MQMHLELRGAVPLDRQCGDGGDLAGAQIQARAAIDITKRKLDDIAAQIRADRLQAVDDVLARLAIDGCQLFPAELIT